MSSLRTDIWGSKRDRQEAMEVHGTLLTFFALIYKQEFRIINKQEHRIVNKTKKVKVGGAPPEWFIVTFGTCVLTLFG